ncbi:MAG: DUF4197 domain-containing protein [Bacteroidota bacterium]
MKKILLLVLGLQMAACTPAELQSALGTVLGEAPLTNEQIGQGLKQALEIGIGTGAERLSMTDGYLKSVHKILLPPEAQEIIDKLKVIPGFADVEQVAIQKINRAAEDAAKKAKPIFVSAIKQMTFQDAMNILMGEKNAATTYLHSSTNTQLYNEFNPVILNSLNKFGAVEYWEKAINKYNQIPFVKKINPRLDDYVTTQALQGLFNMVEKEERDIRQNVSRRTTELMKRVFAKQDS